MGHKPHTLTNLMALDVGSKRIGVAVASAHARLPHPLTTLSNDEHIWLTLSELCRDESTGILVVGLPRGLDGQETSQTAYCRQFADEAQQRLGLPVVMQDEALTSVKAAAELANHKQSGKGDIDALAATYILEDYLREHHEHSV